MCDILHCLSPPSPSSTHIITFQYSNISNNNVLLTYTLFQTIVGQTGFKTQEYYTIITYI